MVSTPKIELSQLRQIGWFEWTRLDCRLLIPTGVQMEERMNMTAVCSTSPAEFGMDVQKQKQLNTWWG